MIDVQNRKDSREIPLQKVGVKNIRYPITVLDKVNKSQTTTATVNLYANLPKDFKGTHMSRFVEVFHDHSTNVKMDNFIHMLHEIRSRLQAQKTFGEITFPYFVEKKAPVSGRPSQMEYLCTYQGSAMDHAHEFFVGIEAPVLTLCPCSKEISSRGAHNQRSKVRVMVEIKKGGFFWIEDIIDIIESSASSGLYTLLKRDDERFVTEHSYDHPVFVEDLVREVTVKIQRLNQFPWFSVEAENMESIHNHDAYAYVERGQRTAIPDPY
jgi:GTP cyclohydrolase I